MTVVMDNKVQHCTVVIATAFLNLSKLNKIKNGNHSD